MDGSVEAAFKLRWDGKSVDVEWGGKLGEATSPGRASIDPGTWPTPYPPSALKIFVEDGHACFDRLLLRGL